MRRGRPTGPTRGLKIYLRHSNKAYNNGKNDTYPYDPPLTEVGRTNAREAFSELIREYGPPDRVVVSPYLRTRQTAEIAKEVLNEAGHLPPFDHDPDLGEYLGQAFKVDNCDSATLRCLEENLRPETLLHNPHPPETRDQFQRRIQRLVERERGKEDVAWYITHGIYIQGVASCYRKKIRHPHPVTGIVISSGQLNLWPSLPPSPSLPSVPPIISTTTN